VLPLSGPALGIATIFSVQWNWNSFFLPLIYLTSQKNYTIAVALQIFSDEFQTHWDLLMAASLVAMLPLILTFFVAQRHYVQGIVFTGVKG
jgi:multiple sugar transport system permease protein